MYESGQLRVHFTEVVVSISKLVYVYKGEKKINDNKKVKMQIFKFLYFCVSKELETWKKVYNTYSASSFGFCTLLKFSDTTEQEFITMNNNRIRVHSLVSFNHERQRRVSGNFRKVQKPKELVE